MTEENKTPLIIKASKRYRNTLFSVYIFLLCTGFLFFYFIFPFLLQKFRNLESSSYYNVAEITLTAFLLFFIAPACYLISIGRKIKHSAQFPFPGMKVLRDTKVLSGHKAIFRGKMLIYLGYFACIISVVSSIHVYFIIHKILSSELIRQLPLF
jgi:hypothetical protein